MRGQLFKSESPAGPGKPGGFSGPARLVTKKSVFWQKYPMSGQNREKENACLILDSSFCGYYLKMFEKNGIVRVAVFNTGKNIPENELENIWIKFSKVDKARTRAYGGNGIGLSIVKAIMDRHNKECGVVNKENGVEFWFQLDCNNSEERLD